MKSTASIRAMLVASVSISAFALALAAPQTAAAADEPATLGEVIVTAQKKSENINDVPLSVTAVSGQKLDAIRSGGGDLRMLSARVPSLTLESRAPISAVSATPISTSMPPSRCRSSMTRWCWKTRC